MALPVNHLGFGPFLVDSRQRLLLRDGKPVPLSPKAFDLLLALVERGGQVVLKDDLMSLLWPETFVEESNLGQHVFQLRKALGDPSYIVTVPGRGYQFAQPVRAIPVTGNQEAARENPPSQVVIKEESQTGRPPASASKLRKIFLAAAVSVVVVVAVAAVTVQLLPSPKVLRVRQITHSGRIEPYGQVLSDGSRLYFTERRGGTDTLAQVPVSGGEPTSISTSVPSMMVYDIDPDKARLLIGSQGPRFNQPLWVVSSSGGSARRVGDIFASAGTVWSPDGDNIFYGHDAQLYKVSDSGDEPEKLLTAPGYIISLRASPDGNLLRFTVRDSSSGIVSLWESSSDGQGLHQLLPGWKGTARHWGDGESYGDWTPDGRYFVLRAIHDGVESYWAIREKGGWFRSASRPVQLYTTPDHLGEPRFSPDGKTLFFTNYQERRELVRYDSAKKLFVPYLGGIPARLLSFSRDGQWVAYRNETDATLWRSRVDGTQKLQLTFPPMEAYHSTWSPDGKAIVFGGRLPGQPSRLYRIPWDGGKPEVLTGGNATDGEPSWSPDGRSIIFEHWTANETGTRHSAIYILDLSTRQTQMLAGTQDFDGVHWSPDGKYAAASDEAGRRLMLFDFAQQHWSELAEGVPYGWGLRWSSDSRYVYYQHIDEGEEQPLFRVGVGDHRIERITSARQILRSDILSYSMTGLTPDNSPLVSLVRRNSDVYALELELP